MPAVGYLIASAFNCMVVLLSNDISLTFLPQTELPLEESIHPLVTIAHVRCNHFVRIQLKDDSSIPLVA